MLRGSFGRVVKAIRGNVVAGSDAAAAAAIAATAAKATPRRAQSSQALPPPDADAAATAAEEIPPPRAQPSKTLPPSGADSAGTSAEIPHQTQFLLPLPPPDAAATMAATTAKATPPQAQSSRPLPPSVKPVPPQPTLPPPPPPPPPPTTIPHAVIERLQSISKEDLLAARHAQLQSHLEALKAIPAQAMISFFYLENKLKATGAFHPSELCKPGQRYELTKNLKTAPWVKPIFGLTQDNRGVCLCIKERVDAADFRLIRCWDKLHVDLDAPVVETQEWRNRKYPLLPVPPPPPPPTPQVVFVEIHKKKQLTERFNDVPPTCDGEIGTMGRPLFFGWRKDNEEIERKMKRRMEKKERIAKRKMEKRAKSVSSAPEDVAARLFDSGRIQDNSR